MFDLDLIEKVYSEIAQKVNEAKTALGRPLTFAEKILYAHLHSDSAIKNYTRGSDYANFAPDRVAMQDATAQMAILQFINSGKKQTAVPSTVHCDHLIIADQNANEDLKNALSTNKEVYDFLESASNKYGIGFWKPGAGIIHQVVLENYAFPGGMMIGTDSHTVNAGGLGMIAVGVGGADAVDVMSGMPWELKMPKLIGVKLTGKMNGWAAPKDVILKLAGILTVKGATNCIVEYFGEGADSISCTGKATICNMGAEIGATTSIFAYGDKMSDYLKATGRKAVAEGADGVKEHLTADPEVYAEPEKYFDQLIEINLDTLEPYINGPFTPDLAYSVSEYTEAAAENGYPEKLDVGLIGSCTNSSYEDLSRSISLIRQANEKGIKVASELIINPGSEQIRYTIERDGIIADYEKAGAVIMTNACGPCIGQWNRHNDEPEKKNSIITSFNRNFARRNDGNPNTYSFVASPEMVTALAIAGKMTFNPLTDQIEAENGTLVKLDPPVGEELPTKGFDVEDPGYLAPAEDGSTVEIIVDSKSDRLQLLSPFAEWDGNDFTGNNLLIKTKGKCTTDHISMAGPWLKYRGHLDNISDNLLMGAVNAFNGETNSVRNVFTGEYGKVSAVARDYKAAGIGSVVVAEENYGEGSSREHAAMEPRHLGVVAVISKSFARIHETNLKKQGVLALTFADKEDYDKIKEDDQIDILGISDIAPGKNVKIMLKHADGSAEEFEATHTYNSFQIDWFKAGSALNLISKNQ